MTYAQINNADDSIIRTFEEAEDFKPPAHKFGPGKASRIVPVVTAAAPEYDPSTHQLTSTQAVEADRVVRGWLVGLRPAPAEVPLWAFRRTLRRRGLWATAMAIINQLPDPQREDAIEHLEYGNYIERGHALIVGVGAAAGLTAGELDDLFREAAAQR